MPRALDMKVLRHCPWIDDAEQDDHIIIRASLFLLWSLVYHNVLIREELFCLRWQQANDTRD